MNEAVEPSFEAKILPWEASTSWMRQSESVFCMPLMEGSTKKAAGAGGGAGYRMSETPLIISRRMALSLSGMTFDCAIPACADRRQSGDAREMQRSISTLLLTSLERDSGTVMGRFVWGQTRIPEIPERSEKMRMTRSPEVLFKFLIPLLDNG